MEGNHYFNKKTATVLITMHNDSLKSACDTKVGNKPKLVILVLRIGYQTKTPRKTKIIDLLRNKAAFKHW